MDFSEENIITEMTDDLTAALSYTFGGRFPTEVMFNSPELVKEGIKSRQYSISGEFNSDTVDGTITANYRVVDGLAYVPTLTFTFDGQTETTVDYSSQQPFITGLANAVSTHKAHINRPTHNLKAQQLVKSLIAEVDALSTTDIKSRLETLEKLI